MKDILKISQNKMIKLVSLTLVGAIIFTFLHSEFGFLDSEGDNHSTHDYCEIVKGARIEKPNTQNKISPPIIKFVKNICSDEYKTTEDGLQNEQFTSTKKILYISTFLINRTILI